MTAYDDEYEYEYDDDENPPLFSWFEIVIITLFMVFGMYGVTLLFIKINEIINIIQITTQNFSLLVLLIYKISFSVFALLLLLLIKRRLDDYSWESLSSYLGFGKPNWSFIFKWSALLIALHALSWGGTFGAVQLRVVDAVASYGVWLTLLGITIIAPIFEELFCRGFLWRAVLDISDSRMLAFWVSGLVFSLAHLNFHPMALVFYMLTSWLTLRARIVGGTLIFSMLLHFIHNYALTLESLMMMVK